MNSKLTFIRSGAAIGFCFILIGGVVQAQDGGVTSTEPSEGVATPPSPKQEKKGEEKKKEDPNLKTGVLSSYGKFQNNAAVNTTPLPVSEDEVAPVTGSVTFSKGECHAVVKNNHKENTYSVNFEVRGVNAQGSTVVRQSYSATLKPDQSITRSLACQKNLDMAVVLKSGKKVN